MEVNQKYKNLKLTFLLDDIRFEVSSICMERIEKPFPMHSHSNNSYEIHYIPSGRGTLNTNTDSYEITPGTLIVTGPELEHEQSSAPNNPMMEFCVYLKVLNSDKAKNDRNSLLHTFLSRNFWYGSGTVELHELMNKILAELSQQSVGYKLVLSALLQQFVLVLCRLYYAESSVPTEDRPSYGIPGDLPSLLVEEAFLYHYDEITLDSLSAMIGLGNRQTERYLKEHYNKSFQEKKTEARMSAAITMLKDNSNTVSAIAAALGYSSVEHFSNAFKRYYKKTPSQMRKELN